MAENGPQEEPGDESSESINSTEWIAINAPELPVMELARKLIDIDNLTRKDTIVSVSCIPMVFSLNLLPEGLELGMREVDLLNHFYNTRTICNVPGCNTVLRRFPTRMVSFSPYSIATPLQPITHQSCVLI